MALQENELRIGNYFLSLFNEVQKLTAIWQRDGKEWWGSNEDNAHFELSTRNPIQLTPEIVNSIKPNLSDNGYTHKWTTTGRLEIQLNYSFITIVDYLHEYQNLYYILLGTELNYTPHKS